MWSTLRPSLRTSVPSCSVAYASKGPKACAAPKARPPGQVSWARARAGNVKARTAHRLARVADRLIRHSLRSVVEGPSLERRHGVPSRAPRARPAQVLLDPGRRGELRGADDQARREQETARQAEQRAARALAEAELGVFEHHPPDAPDQRQQHEAAEQDRRPEDSVGGFGRE